MTDPYARLAAPIPVTVLSKSAVGGSTNDDIAVIRMEPSRHNHASGVECIGCAAASDIRAVLFDLLQSAREGHRPMFTRVVVDASAMPDASDVIDRLIPGKLPALGLRDHAVARNFHLAEVR
ncbi:MAG: hypothetical protein Q8L54_11315 [Devosia sp.]|nr:hypothetical protein [Devosia sp.]